MGRPKGAKDKKPRKERCFETKHGHRVGFAPTLIYSRWAQMIQRCYNPNNKDFKNYGARGIKVCESWKLSFPAFLADMGEPPDKRLTLDRINNDGPYCKENCRWADRSVQRINQRQ